MTPGLDVHVQLPPAVATAAESADAKLGHETAGNIRERRHKID